MQDIERHPQNDVDIYIMYDIACILQKHLEVKFQAIMFCKTIFIPVFMTLCIDTWDE